MKVSVIMINNDVHINIDSLHVKYTKENKHEDTVNSVVIEYKGEVMLARNTLAKYPRERYTEVYTDYPFGSLLIHKDSDFAEYILPSDDIIEIIKDSWRFVRGKDSKVKYEQI